MPYLSIGVVDSDEEIVHFISNKLEKCNSNSDFKVDRVDMEGAVSVVCRIDSENGSGKPVQDYNALISKISAILADYIINKYEDKLISRVINTNYCYFNAREKNEIQKSVRRIMKNEDNSLINSLFRIRRRNIIIKRLMDYFESSNNLILDGFVNFRLKDYTRDLEDIVDKAVDNFLMEREYKEFIKLLRYFVEVQEPKFNAIHVYTTFDGKYILFNERKEEITSECIKELLDEISEGDINYDDLLVSSLITLAPKKIVMHNIENFRNKELLDTIKNVFFGKVSICRKCDNCLPLFRT